MDINFLVKLTARAWALDILAAFGRGVPGRQAPLLAATGASRTAFAQSLAHLIELQLVERNPGHGHPLRPEFRLTELGQQASVLAQRIQRLDLLKDESALLRRSWSVPVLAVCQHPKVFGQIRSQLTPITDRALSQSLKQLHACEWVERQFDPNAHPIRPEYVAANAGAAVGQVVAESLGVLG